MPWAVAAAVAGAATTSIIGGSKGGSSSGNTTTQNTQPQLLPGMDRLLDPLQTGALNAFGRTPDQAIAGFTPDQQAAFNKFRGIANDPSASTALNGLAGNAAGVAGSTPRVGSFNGNVGDHFNPVFDTASTALTRPVTSQNVGTGTFDTGAANKYMSPYLDTTLNSALNKIDYSQGVNTGAMNAKLAGEHAFGSRGDLSASVLQRNQADERNNAISSILDNGYAQARSQYNADSDRTLKANTSNQTAALQAAGLTGSNLAAAGGLTLQQQLGLRGQDVGLKGLDVTARGQDVTQNLGLGNLSLNGSTVAGNLINSGRATDIGNAGLLSTIGGAQQDLNQKVADFPDTRNAKLAGILYGSPTGSNSQTTVPGPSALGQLTGLATAGAGLYNSFKSGSNNTKSGGTTDWGGTGSATEYGGDWWADGGRVGFDDGGGVTQSAGASPLPDPAPTSGGTLLSQMANAGTTILNAQKAGQPTAPGVGFGHVTRGSPKTVTDLLAALARKPHGETDWQSVGNGIKGFADGGDVADDATGYADPSDTSGDSQFTPLPNPTYEVMSGADKYRDSRRDNALLAAGLAMMASKSPHAMTAIGEGGMAGLREFNDRPVRDASIDVKRAQATGLQTQNELSKLDLDVFRRLNARDTAPTKAGGIADAAQGPAPLPMPAVASGMDASPLPTLVKTFENTTGDPGATNGNAVGDGMFKPKTWLELAKKYPTQLGITPDMNESEVLAKRADPKAAATGIGLYAQDNAASLEKEFGVQPSKADLVSAHFLGASGAASLKKAPADTFAADVLPSAASANRPIFYDGERPRTVGEVREVIAARSGADATAQPQQAGGPLPAPTSQAAASPPPMIDLGRQIETAHILMRGPKTQSQGIALLNQAQEAIKSGRYIARDGIMYAMPGANDLTRQTAEATATGTGAGALSTDLKKITATAEASGAQARLTEADKAKHEIVTVDIDGVATPMTRSEAAALVTKNTTPPPRGIIPPAGAPDQVADASGAVPTPALPRLGTSPELKGVQEAAAAQTKEAQEAAANAATGQKNVRVALGAIENSPTGVGADARLELGRFAKFMGASDEQIAKHFGNTVDGQLLVKNFFQIAADRARGQGPREPGFVLLAFQKASPNLSLETPSNKLLMNLMDQDYQHQRDYAQARVDATLGPKRSAIGVENSFNEANPPEKYIVKAYAGAGEPLRLPKNQDQAKALLKWAPSGMPIIAPDGSRRFVP